MTEVEKEFITYAIVTRDTPLALDTSEEEHQSPIPANAGAAYYFGLGWFMAMARKVLKRKSKDSVGGHNGPRDLGQIQCLNLGISTP